MFSGVPVQRTGREDDDRRRTAHRNVRDVDVVARIDADVGDDQEVRVGQGGGRVGAAVRPDGDVAGLPRSALRVGGVDRAVAIDRDRDRIVSGVVERDVRRRSTAFEGDDRERVGVRDPEVMLLIEGEALRRDEVARELADRLLAVAAFFIDVDELAVVGAGVEHVALLGVGQDPAAMRVRGALRSPIANRVVAEPDDVFAGREGGDLNAPGVRRRCRLRARTGRKAGNCGQRRKTRKLQ